MNLINNLNGKKFRGATLGGCFFFKKKKDQLCLKREKVIF